MTSTLRIEVQFDLICPWCLIGKRHLTTALQQFRRLRPEVPVEVSWTPVELLPGTPREGLPYQAFYERRLGGPAAVAARRAQVREAGRAAGLEFAFEDIRRLPNTRAAHGLIAQVQREGSPALTAALIEGLFTAYFLEARDIGDTRVLARIAAECGLGRPDFSATDDGNAPAPGLHGVPYFVFNERFPLSGAHPPETLLEAMQVAMLVVPMAESAVF